MRLEDKEIERAEPHHYPDDDYGIGYVDGAKFARDFYENQKCKTCRIENICPIRKYATSKIQNFGCREWEPRK